MFVESNEQFVKRYKPAAICVKIWEPDHGRYDWCVVENHNSFVLGSGKTPDSAWSVFDFKRNLRLRCLLAVKHS